MNKVLRTFAVAFLFQFLFSGYTSRTDDQNRFWLKVEAKDKFARSLIADQGFAIDYVGDDYVIVIGSDLERQRLEASGKLLVQFKLEQNKDFPSRDEAYHDYAEMTAELKAITDANPEISQMISIGKSTENRDIWSVRISGNLETASTKPGIVFLGGHHAREHLSVELPIAYIQTLINQYRAGDARIVRLVDNRDIHIIPAVNPDGLEFDSAGGNYKFWRKNRTLNGDGSYGVDLNRNYGYKWATGGSSANPGSDTYHGPSAFSEPETKSIKTYIETHTNLTTLLSFHTFSELILYPWGHTYDSIANARDRQAYVAMAKKMSEWNGYTPEQSSDLYITSGDTTDWAYGEHGIFAFTFELDPKSQWQGGFYPGADVIKPVIAKNLEPVLYLIDRAENPYQDLDRHPYKPF